MTNEPDADQDEDEEAPFDPGAGAIDIPKLSQAIIHMLQTDRLKYKRFGIYWWPIKAMLKRAGYTRAQLSMLGDFEDPETAAMVPELTLEQTGPRAGLQQRPSTQ